MQPKGSGVTEEGLARPAPAWPPQSPTGVRRWHWGVAGVKKWLSGKTLWRLIGCMDHVGWSGLATVSPLAEPRTARKQEALA